VSSNIRRDITPELTHQVTNKEQRNVSRGKKSEGKEQRPERSERRQVSRGQKCEKEVPALYKVSSNVRRHVTPDLTRHVTPRLPHLPLCECDSLLHCDKTMITLLSHDCQNIVHTDCTPRHATATAVAAVRICD
jgi:hypothetical protein